MMTMMTKKPHLVRAFNVTTNQLQTIRADDLAAMPTADHQHGPLRYEDTKLAKEAYRRIGHYFPGYDSQTSFIRGLESERQSGREISIYIGMADALDHIIDEQSPDEKERQTIAMILLHTTIGTVDISAILNVSDEMVRSVQRYYYGESPTEQLSVWSVENDNRLNGQKAHANLGKMSRPVAALCHPETGEAMREKFRCASVVIGVDTAPGSNEIAVFFGRDALSADELMLKEPDAIVFRFDFRTESLKLMVTATQDIQGYCDYV